MSLNETDGPRDLLLKGARVVTPAGVIEDARLLLSHGRIARIGQGTGQSLDGAKADGAKVLDLDGATLVPGFMDIHIHGALGVDVTEADTEDLRRVARFLAPRGVTS